jgi:hypothetical protein
VEGIYTAGAVRTIVVVLAAASLAACQSNPSAPTALGAPTINLSGTWSGTGSDSFSPELVTWVLSQAGNAVSGTAELKAVNPSDGTCGSCHKVKTGTLTGTLSGSTLTVSMKFPAGGDVPAPICVAELSATAIFADRRITATYTGTDTCEGVYSNGAMELTR